MRVPVCSVLFVLSFGALAGCGGTPPASHSASATIEAEWPFNGHSSDGQRYSPLRQIDTRNVQRLGLAWEFRDFVVRGRTHHGMQSNPLVVGGVMYLSSPWGFAYALDARSGRKLWQFDPRADGQYGRSACCDVVNRGIAIAAGRVYVASLDGFLYALDARTGAPLWKTDTFVDRHWIYTITGAPLVAGDNVLIGNAGADMGARGYLSAYNRVTGKLAWRFWSVPGDPKRGPDETPEVTRARPTWASDTRWDLGGGGAVWDSMAYDAADNTVYFGTGNGSPHPHWLRSAGGGDNLYIDSLIAVDAGTGRLKWYYQQTPGDSWDFDATAPMVLADLELEGRQRQVLMQASKNGFFYVLDRRSGELLKADPYTVVNWAERIDLKSGRPQISARVDFEHGPRIVAPSSAGGHGWQPIAFNPQTGLLYFSAQETPMRVWADPTAKFLPGTMNQAIHGQFPPFTDEAARKELKGQPAMRVASLLKAWNPVTAQVVWQTPAMPLGLGGTLATAGGLVFAGGPSGELMAYDAQSGAVLARIATGTVIGGAPITYQLDGVQYIAVTAGAGGPMGAMYSPEIVASRYQNFERLIVLRLGGGPVPLPPAVSPPPLQPVPDAIPASAATLKRGAALYAEQCARCHVPGGAFGAFPNLWNLSASTLAAFDVIVRGGALREAGMASFADVLSPADAAAIKAYMVTDERRRRADAARGLPAPAEATAVSTHGR